MKLFYVACPECRNMLTSEGCLNASCSRGVSSGFTLPPPPKFSDQPDPFPEKCPTCGQAKPKKPDEPP